MSFEPLLTANEVSELFRIDLQRVYDLTRRRLLPCVRLGERQLRFSRQTIERFIQDGGNYETGTKEGEQNEYK